MIEIKKFLEEGWKLVEYNGKYKLRKTF